MKRLLLCSALSLILAGCGTSRQVSIVERSVHDTLYLNKIQYDSIFIDNYQTTDRINDTVYLEKVRLEYKYKFLKDTVRVVSVDSIPVIHTVKVTKTVKHVPTIYKWSLGISITLLIIALAIIVIRLISAIRVL